MYDTSYNIVPFLLGIMTFFAIFYIIAMVFALALTAAEYVGRWFTFKKMNLPGWKGIIPFYNIYCLFKEMWNTAAFKTTMIYYGVFFVCMLIGEFLTMFGTPFMMEGATHSETGFTVAGVIVLVIGLLLGIAAVVFAVLYIVMTYKLYVRLANSFGKSKGWAFGLLFLSPVFFLILGFDKKLVYYGRVDGE